MTELEEVAEVFLFPPPSHLPHPERACSFLLYPYPDPRELFAAVFQQKKMSTLTGKRKPRGCNQ